jgi:hypothetical protein
MHEDMKKVTTDLKLSKMVKMKDKNSPGDIVRMSKNFERRESIDEIENQADLSHQQVVSELDISNHQSHYEYEEFERPKQEPN